MHVSLFCKYVVKLMVLRTCVRVCVSIVNGTMDMLNCFIFTVFLISSCIKYCFTYILYVRCLLNPKVLCKATYYEFLIRWYILCVPLKREYNHRPYSGGEPYNGYPDQVDSYRQSGRKEPRYPHEQVRFSSPLSFRNQLWK